MKNKALVLVVASLFFANVHSQQNKLFYKFQLNESRDSIYVTMMYQFSKDDVSFSVPFNYDNTTLTNSVLIKNLELLTEGELIEEEDGVYRYTGKEKRINLKYTVTNVSSSPEYLPCQGSAYFQPAITTNFFHMYGDMSLVLPRNIGDNQNYFDLEIEWIGFPDDWHMANDFGISKLKIGHRLKQFGKDLTIENLGESLFFGGDYRKTEFSTNGINFHTYIYGDFQFTDQDLVSQIEAISKSQMQYWKHFNHTNEYVISITQKGKDCGKLNGRNMFDSFSFYLSGNFTKKHIPIIFSRALTHEFTHSWIGTNLIGNNPRWEEMRWFLEGFTEYYSWLINLKANVINNDDYLSILNSKISSYFRTPYAKTTLKEFVEKYQFSDKFRKLAYDKGAVFAFYLDGYIRNQSKNKYNLKDYMIVLLDTEKERINGNLNTKILVDLANEYFNVEISQ